MNSDALRQLSGLEQLQAIISGQTGYQGMVQRLGFVPVSAEEGYVAFEASPDRSVYNPIGTVHGGYTATLLDTVMGCAVHSCLKSGQAYTTLELKVAYHKALTDISGPLRAEGRIVSFGKRAAFAEGAVRNKAGELCATGTTTCIVIGI